jgi:hypothetical protein
MYSTWTVGKRLHQAMNPPCQLYGVFRFGLCSNSAAARVGQVHKFSSLCVGQGLAVIFSCQGPDQGQTSGSGRMSHSKHLCQICEPDSSQIQLVSSWSIGIHSPGGARDLT